MDIAPCTTSVRPLASRSFIFICICWADAISSGRRARVLKAQRDLEGGNEPRRRGGAERLEKGNHEGHEGTLRIAFVATNQTKASNLCSGLTVLFGGARLRQFEVAQNQLQTRKFWVHAVLQRKCEIEPFPLIQRLLLLALCHAPA